MSFGDDARDRFEADQGSILAYLLADELEVLGSAYLRRLSAFDFASWLGLGPEAAEGLKLLLRLEIGRTSYLNGRPERYCQAEAEIARLVASFRRAHPLFDLHALVDDAVTLCLEPIVAEAAAPEHQEKMDSARSLLLERLRALPDRQDDGDGGLGVRPLPPFGPLLTRPEHDPWGDRLLAGAR